MPAGPHPSVLLFSALYARMREGDAASWTEFQVRYAPLLRQMARHWLNPQLRSQADSEDMVQSVLRILLQSDGRLAFENEEKFRAWLATVMRHRVMRLARRTRAPGGVALKPMEDGGEPVEVAPDPAALAEKAEAIHRLKTAMDLLTRDEKELICLRDFEDLEFGDIAKRLDRPSADAARKAFGRARKRLEHLLREGVSAGDPGKQ